MQTLVALVAIFLHGGRVTTKDESALNLSRSSSHISTKVDKAVELTAIYWHRATKDAGAVNLGCFWGHILVLEPIYWTLGKRHQS